MEGGRGDRSSAGVALRGGRLLTRVHTGAAAGAEAWREKTGDRLCPERRGGCRPERRASKDGSRPGGGLGGQQRQLCELSQVSQVWASPFCPTPELPEGLLRTADSCLPGSLSPSSGSPFQPSSSVSWKGRGASPFRSCPGPNLISLVPSVPWPGLGEAPQASCRSSRSLVCPGPDGRPDGFCSSQSLLSCVSPAQSPASFRDC